MAPAASAALSLCASVGSCFAAPHAAGRRRAAPAGAVPGGVKRCRRIPAGASFNWATARRVLGAEREGTENGNELSRGGVWGPLPLLGV